MPPAFDVDSEMEAESKIPTPLKLLPKTPRAPSPSSSLLRDARFVGAASPVKRTGKFDYEGAGMSGKAYRQQGDRSMYTKDSLQARARARDDSTLRHWLRVFWQTFGDAVTAEGVAQSDWVDVHVSMCKALLLPMEFHLTEAKASIHRDWLRAMEIVTQESDSRMPQEVFDASLFELCDIWSVGTSVEEYREFLRCLYVRITAPVPHVITPPPTPPPPVPKKELITPPSPEAVELQDEASLAKPVKCDSPVDVPERRSPTLVDDTGDVAEVSATPDAPAVPPAPAETSPLPADEDIVYTRRWRTLDEVYSAGEQPADDDTDQRGIPDVSSPLPDPVQIEKAAVEPCSPASSAEKEDDTTGAVRLPSLARSTSPKRTDEVKVDRVVTRSDDRLPDLTHSDEVADSRPATVPVSEVDGLPTGILFGQRLKPESEPLKLADATKQRLIKVSRNFKAVRRKPARRFKSAVNLAIAVGELHKAGDEGGEAKVDNKAPPPWPPSPPKAPSTATSSGGGSPVSPRRARNAIRFPMKDAAAAVAALKRMPTVTPPSHGASFLDHHTPPA